MTHVDLVAFAAIRIAMEILPERLVFVTFVPSMSVLGALMGGSVALIRRLDGQRRAIWAEIGALLGGAVGALIFIGGFLLQEVM